VRQPADDQPSADLDAIRDAPTSRLTLDDHDAKGTSMAMTPKEGILKAFALGKGDRVPVTLFGAGMWSIKDFGTSFEALAHDPQKMADMCVAEAARIRSDVVYVGSGYNNFHASALGKAFGVGIKFREMGAPDLTAHFVNSEEDLAKLDIADVHRDPVVQTVLEATRLVKAKIGETYLVTMTCWGPFTLAARMVGEETFMKATFKKPAFVEKMVDFCADLLIHVYEPLVRGGLECLSIADPTASGDLINKKQMERFAVPGLKKLTGWAKGKGVHSICTSAATPATGSTSSKPPGRAPSSSIRRSTWRRPGRPWKGR
jgi:uroporphyrinogen decarboxylase